ncbi:MAG: hypothetical protein ACOX75_05940 [Lachnospiraceae bacterium]|jgi:hypothetical protein
MATSKSQKKIIWDIIWAVLFACGTVFILWKCRYGFGNMDEAFYLTIPYRLSQGDGLFVHEWHLSQMSGFLILPLMKLYMAIAGTTEGIILAFRYIYTVIQALAALFIYFRLRKTHQQGAALASIAFLLYAPFGIMALSYNSLGIICLAGCLVIMVTSERLIRLQQAAAGMLFACAVLCCPYLILIFAVYFITVLICTICKRAKGIFSFKSWLFFTVGAAVVAAVFAAFVLSRGSISQIFAAFPSIMNDPDHQPQNVFRLVVTYFTSILYVNKKADIGYAGLFVCAVIALADRKRANRRAIYFTAAALLTLFTITCLVYYGRYLNYVMFPVNIMAVVCFIINKDETTEKLLCGMWIPGMLYSMCLHASSNQEFYAISSASTVALIAGLMIVTLTADRIYREQTGAAAAISVIMMILIAVCQLGSEAYLRYNAVFWSNMNELMTTPQSDGVEKGLYLSEAADRQYRMTLEIATHIKDNYASAESVAFIANETWLYLLCSDKRMASYSAWLALITGEISQSYMTKQMKYYELNPDKIPDIVYLSPDNLHYSGQYKAIADYEEDELSTGGILLVK